MSKSDLTSLLNIGKVLSKQLNDIGINTQEELMLLGSENTFIRLQTIDQSSSINKLFALEGAIQGVKWNDLTSRKKQDLKIFYKLCKAQQKCNQ